ncbi:MAG: DUF2232 domain-containing protein [Tissierellia bacterium]|jgi:uncharacterized protein YybS (DUF2232 family)|nr:DUF2232 domain-containing protein [Tissierellia bacterium]
MNNEKMTNIFELAGVILGMSLFTLASLYFFPLMFLIFPVVFIVLGIKNGLLEGIISLMTTCTIVAFVIEPMTALYIFLLFGPLVISMIYTIKKRKSTMEVLLVGTISFFASIIVVFGIINYIEGNLLLTIEQAFKETLNIRIEALKDMGLTSYEILENKKLLEDAFKYMLLIAPATGLLTSLIVSYMNYSLTIIGLRRIGIYVVNIPRFSRFRLPNNISIGIIVMFITGFVAKQLNFDYFDTIAINLTVLIGIMFSIQGLSVIDFFLIKIKVKKFFRILFILLTIIAAPLMTVVSGLGLIDVIFDLRKLKRKDSL